MANALRLLLASLVVFLATGTQAVDAGDPGAQHQTKQLGIELISDVTSIAPGSAFRLGVRMRMELGWHVYWRESGDAGMPPGFTWTLPAGFEVSEPAWPLPTWHKTEGAWSIVYDPEVLFVFWVRAPKSLPEKTPIALDVEWVVCHDDHGCIPGQASLSMQLAKSKDPSATPSSHVTAFDLQHKTTPRAMPATWSVSAAQQSVRLAGDGPWASKDARFEFFPHDLFAIDRESKLGITRAKDRVTIRLPCARVDGKPPASLRGVLVVKSGAKRHGYTVGWKPSDANLVTLATTSATRPGNIAVTPAGRVIVTNQPLDGPSLRIIEVLPDGSIKPFPTEDWADGPEKGEVGIAGTIGIIADTKGVVWLLDMGSDAVPARILAWDTLKERLHREIVIPKEVVTPISFLQDFALDEKRGQIYIADMTFPPPGEAHRPAIIVLDLKTGKARRVLERADALMPVAYDVVIEGSVVGGKPAEGKRAAHRLGINPIAIDPSFEWVYFGTINGDDVFRLPAKALADTSLDDKALAATITTYGKKRPSDGIAVDGKGRVFITDVESSAVGVCTPDGYRILHQDKTRLAWPDAFAVGPDGWLYIAQNSLHTHPALNEGVDESVKPYFILKLRLDP